MIANLDYPQLFGLVIAVLIGAAMFLWLISRFEEPVHKLLKAVIQLLAVPVALANDAATSLANWLLRQARAAATLPDKVADHEWIGWPIVGAFFCAVIVAVNIYAEWCLLVMTLPLLGFAFSEGQLPQDAVTLTALAIISLGLFWGGMLSESIGLTSLTPWRHRNRRDRMVLGLLSLAVLGAILWSSWQIGRVRGFQMGFQPEDYATSQVIDADAIASAGTWDASSPQVPNSQAQASTAVPSTAATADTHAAEYGQMQRDLPISINGILVVLSVLTFILGKWSLSHSLAYLASLALSLLWLLVWPVQFLVRVANDMIVSMRDELLPSVTNLAHRSTKDMVDLYLRRRDEAFDRGVADIRAAAENHFDELGKEALRSARSVNGAVADVVDG